MKRLLLAIFIWPAVLNADTLNLSGWETNMLTYGKKNCDYLKGSASQDQKLQATYYDAQSVFQSIADYTLDQAWVSCGDAARKVYRDGYVIPNNGALPGFWNFTKGLRTDWEKRGAVESKRALGLLAVNGAWAADSAYNNTNMPLAEFSRETAYVGEAYINNWRVGAAYNPRTDKLVQFALGHYDQWFVSHSAPYVRPFMAALTAEFLIQYYEEVSPDPKILSALKIGASWLWDNCWVEAAKAFKYTDRAVDSGGTEPAPDLNMLIAPLYSWLYRSTGDSAWADKAVRIFNGGVSQSFLSQGKQFNQNYRWSFRVVSDLAGGGVVYTPTPTRTGTTVPTGTATRTVTPTPYVTATPTPTVTPTAIVITVDGPSEITIKRR